MGVLGMVDGKGGEVTEVGVGGSPSPGADGGSNGVSRRRAAGSFAERLTEQGKIIGAKLWG